MNANPNIKDKMFLIPNFIFQGPTMDCMVSVKVSPTTIKVNRPHVSLLRLPCQKVRVKSAFPIVPLQYHLYYMRPNGHVKKKLRWSFPIFSIPTPSIWTATNRPFFTIPLPGPHLSCALQSRSEPFGSVVRFP
jgi:hypothetical protein